MTSAKIAKAKKHIIMRMNQIDTSGQNGIIHKEKFNKMSDRAFIEYCKNREYTIYTEYSQEAITFTGITKTLKDMKVPVEEKLYMPHIYKNKDGKAIKSKYPMMILPLHIRRLTQMILSENKTAVDTGRRDKFNMVAGDSKATTLNVSELNVMVTKGYDAVPTELFTARAGHTTAKRNMNKEIEEDGTFHLAKSDYANPQDKHVSKYMHALYISGYIATDLLENDIEKYTK